MVDAVAGEVLMAHPVALLALPAFIPVVVIVGVVLWVARRDRLAEARELAEAEPPALAAPAGTPED